MSAVAREERRGRVARRIVPARVAAAMLAVAAGFALQPPAAAASEADSRADLIAQALAYEHGEGVQKDLPKAADLYCEASRAGDPEAMFALGWMYANGRGVVRDDTVAASLFERAASFGHSYAREMLKFVGEGRGVMPACMMPPAPEPEATDGVNTDPFAILPAPKMRVADIVRSSAPLFGIDPQFALAIAAVESDFEPEARSPKDARGVMQLVSGTAARFNVAQRKDVAGNVQGGLAYMRWLLAYYEGRVRLVAAAYNAGEAAVDRYRGVPPYPETREYVRRVQRLFPNETHPYDPTVASPSPAFPRADPAE